MRSISTWEILRNFAVLMLISPQIGAGCLASVWNSATNAGLG
jgi:hypothetical protein